METARALAAGVRSGALDPVDLVEQALARLGDDPWGAFALVDAEGARAQARSCLPGPLQGVPVGVKDLFDVAGQVTRAGSEVPAGPPATADSPVVARLRAAGAVVLGRTRTHEFAWGITTRHPRTGGTANPADLGRVAGGSSGGSAAAVAAGVVPLAVGTDTGASIRLPAAWCGVVGFKPTHGSVPLDGVVPLAPSLDTGGPLTGDVEDARLAFEVLSGRPLPAPRPVSGLRLGVVGAPGLQDVAESAGLRLSEQTWPLHAELVRAYGVVQGAEALGWHRATGRWPAHAEQYGDDVRGQLERCEQITAEQLRAAQEVRAELRRHLAMLFEDVDVLLAPVALCGPATTAQPDTGRYDGVEAPLRDLVLPWTVPVNLGGLPACTVRAGVDADGLPVGVQVVGRPGADGLVLDVAAALDR